jgi:uncharacterized protein YbjT (DUF2867 family)
MRVAITTPTGNIGRELVRILQAETDHALTLLARDPSKLAAEVERGAAVERGDLLDPHFVVEATRGADVLFFLIPPNFAAEDFRGFQNQVTASGVQAVRDNQIAHVILLSSVGAQHGQGVGPVNGLHDAEVAFADTGATVTVLRPGWFMENYLTQLDAIRGTGSVYMPVPGATMVPMIATADIGRVAADVLRSLPTASVVLELLGPRDVSLDEAAHLIGEAIGRSVHHVQVTPEQAQEAFLGMGLGADLTRLYLEVFRGYATGLLAPEAPRTAASTTPTEFATFAKRVLAPALG